MGTMDTKSSGSKCHFPPIQSCRLYTSQYNPTRILRELSQFSQLDPVDHIERRSRSTAVSPYKADTNLTTSSEMRSKRQMGVTVSGRESAISPCSQSEESMSNSEESFVPHNRRTKRQKLTRRQAVLSLSSDSEDDGSDDIIGVYRVSTLGDLFPRSDNGSGTPRGWRKLPDLRHAAKRLGGTVIQFRVIYSDKPIKDSSIRDCPSLIEPGSLVVQSRFASTGGNCGGNTFSFARWKLPGNLLQKKKSHITIYEDTRPKFFDESSTETSNPLIVIDPSVSIPKVRSLIEQFVNEAEPATTPTEFFGSSTDNTADVLWRRRCLAPAVQEAEPELNESAAAHGEASSDEGKPRDTESENKRKRNEQPAAQESQKRRRLVSQEDSTNRVHGLSTVPHVFGKRRRTRYGRGKVRPSPVFQFEVTSRETPFAFGLIEGVVGSGIEHSSPSRISSPWPNDYLSDVLLNGRPEYLPQHGRVLELPNEPLVGSWKCTTTDSGTPRLPPLREQLRDLKRFRLQFRHESVSSVGPLSYTSPEPSSPGECMRDEMTGDNISVSVFSPSSSCDGRLADSGLDGGTNATGNDVFVGSVSIVVFDGFTSSSEATKRRGEVASEFLKNCRQSMIQKSALASWKCDSLRQLLPIHDFCTERTTVKSNTPCVGASFVCKIDLSAEYKLLIGSVDERIAAIDGKSKLIWSKPGLSPNESQLQSFSIGPTFTVAMIHRSLARNP